MLIRYFPPDRLRLTADVTWREYPQRDAGSGAGAVISPEVGGARSVIWSRPMTNREIASLILIMLVIGFAVYKDPRGMASTALGVLKAAFAWKLLLIYVLYVAYVATLVWLANMVDLWDFYMLKDTILTAVVVGFPLVASGISGNSDGGHLIRDAAKATVGLSALVAAYVNLESLPLLVELVLQAVGVVATALAVFASRRENGRPATIFANVILVIVGLILLVATAVGLLNRDWTAELALEMSLTLAMSVWLPIAALPFAYVAGMTARLEILLMLLKLHNGRLSPPLRVRFAVAMGLRGRLLYARKMTGDWLLRLAAQTTFGGASRAMREFRRSVRTGRAQRT